MTNTKPKIVNATPELLEKFYGQRPSHTVRAVVAVKDDDVIGVAGICIQNGRAIVFSEKKEGTTYDKRTIVQGIRRVMGIAAQKKIPVYAVADPKIDGSDTLLRHMGFMPTHENSEVYSWQC